MGKALLYLFTSQTGSNLVYIIENLKLFPKQQAKKNGEICYESICQHLILDETFAISHHAKLRHLG